jgi:hypothetical protein
MNIEEQLKNLKNEYQSTKAPSYLVYDSWPKLRLQLANKKGNLFSGFFKKALIFAALLLVILVTTAKASQAAKPGDKLYAVKLATENIASIVTGNQNNKIENRVEEIINLTKNNDGKLNDTVKRYEDTLDASKNNTSDKQKQELKNTLIDQEQKLRGAQTSNSQDQKLIEKALEKTHEVQGEIKGEKDNNSNLEEQQKRDTDKNSNENNRHGSNDSRDGN